MTEDKKGRKSKIRAWRKTEQHRKGKPVDEEKGKEREEKKQEEKKREAEKEERDREKKNEVVEDRKGRSWRQKKKGSTGGEKVRK